ncbi:glycosyltransferase family 4 protein [Priestia megaterium]|uniref:glycosyltransferase family 4 protein n=1 Tax=Priestia megaterium TaxID=1404 RepID=UPI0022B8E435|nr:glycosyltransferase [Priestia megaterium]MCZ8493355.1 glycosyltransferase [Priestia megaterium]
MSSGKKNILIIMGRYLPGYKDGGPVRSIKNLVDFLGDEYNFQILTCDRDHGDTEPYPNIKVNDWNQIGEAKVYYVPPKGFTFKVIRTLAKQVDLLYVCGCFNDYAINTLILKRLGIIKKPVVVAAMGLFSPMEFQLKYKKKKTFTTLFNSLGLFKNIYWSATSSMEINEISQQIKTTDNFFIAEDLPRKVKSTFIEKHKEEGKLRVVWISRIAPKKNLLGAIEMLKQVRSEVEFTIYGPIHVEGYWLQCKKELGKLPKNVKWSWRGNIESEKVVETLKPYHIFLFPTLGENYGHVIQEALSAGCVALLSDQTPWRYLEHNGAGYVYSLESIDKFVETIEDYSEMNQADFQQQSENALNYILKNSESEVRDTGYRKIFENIN